MSDDTTSEEPKKGRSNAILTYETVEQLNLGIQEVRLTTKAIKEDITDINRIRDDHEVRIRALELAQARQGGALSTGSAAFLAIWPVAGVLLTLLAYLNK
jgi:hypothetical protein